MERRISSSFTEFYKIYGVLCVIIFFAVFEFPFFDPSDLWSSVFGLSILILTVFFTVDAWRMKEVELTDSGLIITSRTFFNQKTIFVPYENIESVKNKLWWFGNRKRVSIEFTKITDFGKEIPFMSNGWTRTSQIKIVEELNRTVIHHKTSDKLNSAYQELNN